MGTVGQIKKGLLHDFIQAKAREQELEGYVTLGAPSTVTIVALGTKENIDLFIDILHRESLTWGMDHIEVESFIKDRDYRGIFRVIE